MTQDSMPWDVLAAAAKAEGIDPKLVAGIAMTESSGRRYVFRYEPNYIYLVRVDDFAKSVGISRDSEMVAQKTSYSYMQIMGGVARELGFSGLLPELFEPEKAFAYGCKHLARFVKKYSDINEVIASYNAGSPRYLKTPKGQVLFNLEYVNKVKAHMAALDQVVPA